MKSVTDRKMVDYSKQIIKKRGIVDTVDCIDH